MTKRWRDLLTALVVLPILLLFARAWLGELPPERRQIIAAIAGFLIAMALAKKVQERIGYHRTEGALAHHAQQAADALAYSVPLAAAGMVLLLAGLLAIGAPADPWIALSVGAGSALGLFAPILKDISSVPMSGPSWAHSRVSRPSHRLALAAISSAMAGAFCALFNSGNHLDAIVAGGYAVLVAIMAGRVDAAAVRYMAMTGHSSMGSLRRWLPLQISLLVPAAAVLSVFGRDMAAVVLAIAAIGVPAITILRIFAYRAFGRMLADWLVTVLVAVAAYLTLAFPPLGPLGIVAAALWLARRGKDRRWLIA